MIIWSIEFKKLIKKVMDLRKNSDLNLTLMGYYLLDNDGELINFQTFLAENVLEDTRKSTYKLNHLSGFAQPILNLATVPDYIDFGSLKLKIETERLYELYGEDKVEENHEAYLNGEISEEEYLECDWDDDILSDKALNQYCDECAAKIEEYIVNCIIKEKLVSKFYGFGYVDVKSHDGDSLLRIIYGDLVINNKVYCMTHKLRFKEKIDVDYDTVKEWLNKAQESNKKCIKVFEGLVPCNGEVEECNNDHVTIYIKNEDYRIIRNHMC